jgi:Bifunctional DNA primase/polymerase, N-terminal
MSKTIICKACGAPFDSTHGSNLCRGECTAFGALHAPTAVRVQLRAAGFSPIPLYGKEPPVYGKNNQRKGLAGWQNLHNATADQIDLWAKTWPDAGNTGVLTKFTPAIDIDILHLEAAEAIEALAREHFEEHGDILVRFGKAPKRSILLRSDEPFDKMSQSFVAPNGSEHKIEILADGQQLVVAGIHPDTKQPYHWHGGEPGEFKREDLPYVREGDARDFLGEATTLLIEQFDFKLADDVDADDADKGIPPEEQNEWQRLNTKALANLPAWVPEIFPSARPYHGGYRVSSADLGRDLEEDLSLVPQGIKDFGVHDIGDPRRGGRTPIDIVMEYVFEVPIEKIAARKNTAKFKKACDWLRERLPQQEEQKPVEEKVVVARRSLTDVHQVFRKWLGDEYDLDAINAVLAAAASERLAGDPLWLLIISGPGAAKTETVQALSGAGAHVTSTIASEGALLSASPKKSRAKTATGGLLCKIGNRGLLVIKDVTSILSADRNIRGSVLAAIREIYDGRWERNVGTDGGQTLTWVGRIVIVGAVTTAWDSAHAVVAAMGDRFVSLRIDSKCGRVQSGARSIHNTGSETPMREELAAAVGGLIAHASTDETKLSDSEIEQILKAADIVTMARTAVERDYRGDVAYGHAPEMPTRFAKQLAQMVRGGVAIGMSREQAMKLAIRCARDSIPPLRLEILLDVALNPGSEVTGVRKRITKPWTTTKRELEGLQMLGLLLCEEETVEAEEEGGKAKTKWLYRLAPGFDRETLLAMAGIDAATEAFRSGGSSAPLAPPAKAQIAPKGSLGPGSKPARFI